MKKARLILSTATLATLGLFLTTSLSSCHKDDKTCTVGFMGKDCDTEVRSQYNGKYVGSGYDGNGNIYNWSFTFSPDGADATHMKMVISDGGSAMPVTLGVRLTSNSTFIIEPNATQTQQYSGNGIISSTTASISITRTYTPAGGPNSTMYFTFSNLAKQ